VRENTERPESVAVGTTTLVLIQHDRIIERSNVAWHRLGRCHAFAVGIAMWPTAARVSGAPSKLPRSSRHRSRARSGAGRLNASMLADERLESIAGDARRRAGLRALAAAWAMQLSDGRHCGGVAGRISAGTPVYVYAEITGYFLHWLADLTHVESREIVSERAWRAIDWATRRFAAGRVPPTRAYLAAAEFDWRNDAVFFFDQAMLLRGLTAVAEAGIEAPPRLLGDPLVAQLAQFVENDTLRAVRTLHADTVLPQRWSTLGGPFLVKASSRVALADGLYELPPSLLHACALESARWSPVAARIPLDMLHPTLYFAEGLLLADPGRADAIATLLTRCLALQNADGSLPESESGSTLAQRHHRAGVARRPAAASARHCRVASDPHQSLAAALLGRVAYDVDRFDPAAPKPDQYWCAMFAGRRYAGTPTG
jgi:hypothetical protein